MLSVVTGVLLALAPVQEADAAAELQVAVQTLAQAESLQFKLLSESTSAGRDGGESGLGDRRGGMTSGGGYTTTKGVWKKGLPMQLSSSGQVAYKQGRKLVHQNEGGQWQVLEMGRGGRAGRGPEGDPGAGRPAGREGAGGGQGGDRGGDRRAGGVGGPGGPDRAGSGSMGGARALFGLMSVDAPAELFADFPAKIEGVAKEATDGGVVYSGKLSQAGAESLGGRGGMPRPPRGGQAGERPEMQMETSGTYVITVKNGVIVTAVFEVSRAGSIGERTFARTTKRTLKIDQLGEAELEVPEEVLALFQ